MKQKYAADFREDIDEVDALVKSLNKDEIKSFSLTGLKLLDAKKIMEDYPELDDKRKDIHVPYIMLMTDTQREFLRR